MTIAELEMSIQSDAEQTKTAIDKLVSSLGTLKDVSAKISPNLGRFLHKLNEIQQKSGASKALAGIADQMERMQKFQVGDTGADRVASGFSQMAKASKAGTGQAASAVTELKQRISAVDGVLAKMSQQFKSVDSQGFSEMRTRLAEMKLGVTEIGADVDVDSVIDGINKIKDAASSLKEELGTVGESTTGFQKLGHGISIAGSVLFEFDSAITNSARAITKFASMLKTSWSALKSFGSGVKTTVTGIGGAIGSIAGGAGRAIGAVAGLTASFRRLGRDSRQAKNFLMQLPAVMRRIIYFRTVNLIFRNFLSGIREGVRNLAMYSDQFNASMSAMATQNLLLRNTMGATMSPVLQALIPLWIQLSNVIIMAANALQQFMSVITGRGFWYRAVSYAQDYRDSINGAAAAMNNFTAGFDELNVISPPSGGGGGAPDFSQMFERQEIDQRIRDFAYMVKAAFTEIKNWALNIWDAIWGAFTEGWYRSRDRFLNSLLGMFNEVIPTIRDIGNSVADAFRSPYGAGLFEQVFNMLSSVFDLIGSIAFAFRTAWNDGYYYGTKAIQRILLSLTQILGTLENISLTFSGVFRSNVGITFFENLLRAVYYVTGAIGEMANSFSRAWTDIDERFNQGFGERFAENLVTLFSNVLGIIGDISRDIKLAFMSDVGDNFFKSLIGLAGDLLYASNGIVSAFRTAWNEAGAGKDVVESIVTATTNVLNLTREIAISFSRIWGSGGYGTLGYSVMSTTLGIFRDIFDVIGNISGGLADAWRNSAYGQAIWQTLLGFVENFLVRIREMTGSLREWSASFENWDGILRAINGLLELKSAMWLTILDGVIRVGQRMLELLVRNENLERLLSAVLTIVGSVVEAFVSWFENSRFVEWLVDSFVNLAEWLSQNDRAARLLKGAFVAIIGIKIVSFITGLVAALTASKTALAIVKTGVLLFKGAVLLLAGKKGLGVLMSALTVLKTTKLAGLVTSLRYLGTVAVMGLKTKITGLASAIGQKGLTGYIMASKGPIAALKGAGGLKGLGTAAAGIVAKGGGLGLLKAGLIALGPKGWIIGGAIAGAVMLGRYLYNQAAPTRELRQATDELVEGFSILISDIEAGSVKFTENMQGIYQSREYIDGLADRIHLLASQGELSAFEMSQLDRYIGMLNEKVPELNLAFDEQAGSLNIAREAMDSYFGAAGAQERMNELFAEGIRLSEAYSKVETSRGEALELLESAQERYNELGRINFRQRRDLRNQMEEQLQVYSDSTEKLEYLAKAMEYVETQYNYNAYALDEYRLAIEETQSVLEMQAGVHDNYLQSIENMAQRKQSAFSEMGSAADYYRRVAGNAFSGISEDVDNFGQSMIDSLMSAASDIKDKGANMAVLVEAGINDAILSKLKQLPDGGSSEIARLAQEIRDGVADPDLVKQLNAAGEAWANAPVLAMAKEFLAKEGVALDAIDDLVGSMSVKMAENQELAEAFRYGGENAIQELIWAIGSDDAINAAELSAYDLTSAISAGLLNGIDAMLPEISSGGVATADAYMDGLYDGFDMNSPSRRVSDAAYMAGKSFPSGSERAIPYVKNAGTDLADAFIESVEKPIVEGLKGLPLQATESFKSIATNAKSEIEGLPSWFSNDVVQPMKSSIDDLSATSTAKFEQKVGSIMNAWRPLPQWFDNDIVNAIATSIDNLGTQVGQHFEQSLNSIKSSWAIAPSWFYTTVVSVIRTGINALTNQVAEYFRMASDNVQTTWSTMPNWFDTMIILPIRTDFESLSDRISGEMENSSNNTMDSWTPIPSWFETTVTSPIQLNFKNLSTSISQSFQFAAQSAQSEWSGMNAWFQNNVTNPLVQTFRTMESQISGVFGNLSRNMQNLSREIGNVNNAARSIPANLPASPAPRVFDIGTGGDGEYGIVALETRMFPAESPIFSSSIAVAHSQRSPGSVHGNNSEESTKAIVDSIGEMSNENVGLLSEMVGLLQIISGKDTVIQIGDRDIASANDRANLQRGASIYGALGHEFGLG